MCERLKRLLPTGQFSRNVLLLAGGTGLAQALTVLASPALTRLYDPDEFGVFGVYVSLLAPLVVISSLRYDLAVPLPEDDESAISLVALGLIIVVGMSGAAVIGVAVLGQRIAAWTHTPDLIRYLCLLPVGLLAVGCYTTLSYWAVRKKAFAPLGRTKVAQGVGQVVTQLGLGCAGLGTGGLIVGHVVGQASGTTTLAALVRATWREAKLRVSLTRVRRVAHEYRRFPMFSAGGALLNNLGVSIPPVLFAAYYGPEVAGWYGLTQRVLGIPVLIVGQGVMQVYLAEVAQAMHGDRRRLMQLLLKVSRRLGVIALVVGLAGWVGPWCFGGLFGSSWHEAGLYAQRLAPTFMLKLIAGSTTCLAAYGLNHWQSGWDAARLALTVGGIYVAYRMGLTPLACVTWFSLLSCVAYAALFLLNVAGIRRVVSSPEQPSGPPPMQPEADPAAGEG